MAQLHPLEAPGDTRHGGFVVTFPSGLRKTVTWQRNGPVIDSLGVAKHLTAKVLAELMAEDKGPDANATNWVSMTAAVQAIVKAWSDKRKAALYAESTPNLAPGSILHS